MMAGVFAAVASSDTSRDVFMAQQIASGQWFPLAGPAINSMFHLGPLWFYLLSLQLLAVPSAAAVTGAMGAISALQFPLAYRIGCRLSSRDDGLLFALSLALPGWVVTSFGSLTHPVMVIPSLLLGLLAVLAYRDRPNARNAIGVGLALCLMCAAHPTLVLLGALMVGGCMLGAPGLGQALRHAAAMVLIVLLSLTPMLYQQWQLEITDPARLSAYTRSDWSVPSPIAGIRLIYATIMYGPHYLARYWLGLTPQITGVLFGMYLLLLGLAAMGIVQRARTQPRDLRLIIWVFGVLLLHSMFVAAVRDTMPAWMVHAHWLFIAALVALGLGGLWQYQWLRLVIGLLFATCLTWTMCCYAWLNGTIEFPNVSAAGREHPYVDIRNYVDRQGASFRLPRTPFREVFDLGVFDCRPVTLYGHLAQQVDFTYAVGALQRCGSASHIEFGGVPQPDRPAWLGLQHEAWEQAGLQPQRWLGGLGISAPLKVWHSRNSLRPVRPELNSLPRIVTASASEFSVAGQADRSHAVLVAHRAYRYLHFSVVRAEADGRSVEPVYSDVESALFLLPPSESGAPVQWQITLNASADHVDVLTFGAVASERDQARGNEIQR